MYKPTLPVKISKLILETARSIIRGNSPTHGYVLVRTFNSMIRPQYDISSLTSMEINEIEEVCTALSVVKDFTSCNLEVIAKTLLEEINHE